MPARLAALRELGVQVIAGLQRATCICTCRPASLQDVLTAIRLGVPVQCAGDALHPNAERHLRRRVQLASIYPHELLAETVRIAERCHFELDALRYEYPGELVPDGYTARSYLRELTEPPQVASSRHGRKMCAISSSTSVRSFRDR